MKLIEFFLGDFFLPRISWKIVWWQVSLVFQWEKRMSQWSPWRCRMNSIFLVYFLLRNVLRGELRTLEVFAVGSLILNAVPPFILLFELSSRIFYQFARSSIGVGPFWTFFVFHEDWTGVKRGLWRLRKTASASNSQRGCLFFRQALRVQTKERNFSTHPYTIKLLGNPINKNHKNSLDSLKLYKSNLLESFKMINSA